MSAVEELVAAVASGQDEVAGLAERALREHAELKSTLDELTGAIRAVLAASVPFVRLSKMMRGRPSFERFEKVSLCPGVQDWVAEMRKSDWPALEVAMNLLRSRIPKEDCQDCEVIATIELPPGEGILERTPCGRCGKMLSECGGDH